MPTRADILRERAMPDIPFQVEPSYAIDGTSIWRVHIHGEGYAGVHMDIKGARELADEVRPVDGPLAARIDAVVAEIMKMPHHPSRIGS
ncbi:MAG: hypothetical protein Kow00114_15920 [Kiloniellaceae bacterium]